MKVVVLSDLHIDDNSDWTICLYETLKRIKNITKKNEKIIFIILGDIVNGFWKRTTEDIKRFYKKADIFIYKINEELIDNNVEFYFIPGNHDLDGESLESFNEFIERHSRINDAKYEDTLDESVFIFDIEDFRFILVDSNLSRDYNASGKIDGELLKTKGATDKQIILFMHHPPFTRESYSDYYDKALDNPLDIMFLHACKYRIENKEVLLIVDGLSESTSSIFNEFLSKLINLPDGNQCIKAVITKRDNYVLKFLSS